MSGTDAQRFVSNWDRIHKDTSRVLRAATEDKLDWRPKEDMFTLRELIRHIPEAELVLVQSALAGSTQKVPFELAPTADEIANSFDRQHQELAGNVSKLTEDQWKEEVEFHGRRLRRGILLWFVTEHEIHHRGQLYTYYRLAGINPPNLHE